ncbi:MAG TPA: 2,3-bisphosphoglycerate-independent phosphoglycerate mutase [Patescibacteria group bacterium]|nr:2,3-bisphosphoglycerate-independent phosphoglycerate mutase [Patescibacteria group bacterium]
MNPVVLIVLDGFGIAPPGPGNAIYLANPHHIHSLLCSYPYTYLKASGMSVGLPQGEVGNTEVGHLNLGAGRVIYQSLLRINMAIADGTFYENVAFLEALIHLSKTGGKLHLIGLVGEGSVHASVDHLSALLHFCKRNNFRHVFVHAITDGRDSPPKMAASYIDGLEKKLDQLELGEIATVMGRYYAMDRDKRWDRTEKAYICLTKGAEKKAQSWRDVFDSSYKRGITDEFIEPINITKNGEPIALIQEGDAVIFFNFRIDRPRQLTKAFVLDNFEANANKTFYDPYATEYYKKHEVEEKILAPPFKRGEKIKNLYFITMTEYEKDLPAIIAFPSRMVHMPLGRVLSDNSLYQLRLTESEKERFVTYYFNGGREVQFPYEERLIVPSPKVPTYDLKPEMSAYEITDILIKKMSLMKYKFILVNFPNADMVGHTGDLKASIKAVKVIDEVVGRIVNASLGLDYQLLITADHGNIEEKINTKTGEMMTEHTANLVPFIAVSNKLQGKPKKLHIGILADVVPTILNLMGLPKPTEMMGRDLLEEV